MGWEVPSTCRLTWWALRASLGQSTERSFPPHISLQSSNSLVWTGRSTSLWGNSFSDRLLEAHSKLVNNLEAALFKRHLHLRFNCIKSAEILGFCSSSLPSYPIQQTDQRRACRRGTRVPAALYTEPRHKHCWLGWFTCNRSWGPLGRCNTHPLQQPAPCPAMITGQNLRFSYTPLHPTSASSFWDQLLLIRRFDHLNLLNY